MDKILIVPKKDLWAPRTLLGRKQLLTGRVQFDQTKTVSKKVAQSKKNCRSFQSYSVRKLISSTGSKTLGKNFQCQKTDPLGFLIIYFVAENQNNQRGDPLATSRNILGKVSQCRKKPSELSSNDKRLKTMVTKGSTDPIQFAASIIFTMIIQHCKVKFV